jgi:hypothetical protein
MIISGNYFSGLLINHLCESHPAYGVCIRSFHSPRHCLPSSPTCLRKHVCLNPRRIEAEGKQRLSSTGYSVVYNALMLVPRGGQPICILHRTTASLPSNRKLHDPFRSSRHKGFLRLRSRLKSSSPDAEYAGGAFA